MSNLRLVVVGRFCGNEEVVVVEPLFQDSWHEGAANAVDAPPELSAYERGKADCTTGTFTPPHWSSLTYDDFIRGWNDQWAKVNNRRLSR